MFLILLLFLGFINPPPFQQAVNVDVTAFVLPSFLDLSPNIRTVYDMDFTLVDETQTIISIDPIKSTAGTEAGAGYIIIEGRAGVEYLLKFNPEVQIVHSVYPQNKAIITYSLSHSSSPNQSASHPVISQPVRFQLNSAGEYHIWIGGQIDVTNLIDGDYDGEMVLEITHASN